MIALPIGLARKRHTEIVTKSGQTVEGAFVREKEGIIYLSAVSELGVKTSVTVSVADVDTLTIGSRVDESEDTTDE